MWSYKGRRGHFLLILLTETVRRDIPFPLFHLNLVSCRLSNLFPTSPINLPQACINFILNSPNSFVCVSLNPPSSNLTLFPPAPTLSKAVRQELNIKPYHCNLTFPELQVDLSGIATSGFSAVFTETCNKIGEKRESKGGLSCRVFSPTYSDLAPLPPPGTSL